MISIPPELAAGLGLGEGADVALRSHAGAIEIGSSDVGKRLQQEAVRGDVHLLRSPRDSSGHQQRGMWHALVLQSDYPAKLSTSSRAADLNRPGRPTWRLTPDELAEADAALRLVLGP